MTYISSIMQLRLGRLCTAKTDDNLKTNEVGHGMGRQSLCLKPKEKMAEI